jgi:hypothetical protein
MIGVTAGPHQPCLLAAGFIVGGLGIGCGETAESAAFRRLCTGSMSSAPVGTAIRSMPSRWRLIRMLSTRHHWRWKDARRQFVTPTGHWRPIRTGWGERHGETGRA